MEGDFGGRGQAAGPGGDAEPVHEVVHDLPGAVGEGIDGGIGAFLELQFVAVEIHSGAGTGGDDHGQIAGEHRGGVKGDFARGIPVARIEGRLSAASLVVGENDFHTKMLQHFHGGLGYVIEEGIAKAGAHEQNFFSSGSCGGGGHARGASSGFDGNSISDSVNAAFFAHQRHGQQHKEQQSDDFEGENVVGPGPKVIDEAGIRWRVGDKAEVGAQRRIDDRREEKIEIHTEKRPQRARPPRMPWPPSIADRQKQRRADDGKVMQEKRKKGEVRIRVGQRRRDQCLQRGRQSPVVGQGLRPVLSCEQGIACEKGGDVAEMEGQDVVQIQCMLAGAPRILRIAVGAEAEKRQYRAGQRLRDGRRAPRSDQ